MRRKVVAIMLCLSIGFANNVMAFAIDPGTSSGINVTAPAPGMESDSWDTIMPAEDPGSVAPEEAESPDSTDNGSEVGNENDSPDQSSRSQNSFAKETDMPAPNPDEQTESDAAADIYDSIGENIPVEEELAGAGVTLGVASHTQTEIRNFVKGQNPKFSYADSFSRKPVTTKGEYDPGSLSEATLNNALAILNCYRYVAGLSHSVTLDAEYNKKAQAGTLVDCVLGELTHWPSQPDGMSDALYHLGYAGTSNSNLSWNCGSLANAMRAWIGDSDEKNISVLGHRDWTLSNTMGKAGFGACGAYHALYCSDRSLNQGQTNIAWPAANMPLDFFGTRDAWSVFETSVTDTSKLNVTLKRSADSRTWTFYEGCDTSSADSGYFKCYSDRIIFRPNIEGYKNGDSFTVTINGVTGGTLSYKVNFFELVSMTSVSLPSSISVERDDTTSLSYTYLPKNATYRTPVWSSSNTSVCTVSSSGIVTGIAPGKATVTVRLGNLSASCQVTVTKYSISAPGQRAFGWSVRHYTGNPIELTVKQFVVNGKELSEGKDFTVSFKNNINAGDAKMILTGIGDYTGT